MKITRIKARQILDSRGNPTVEVDVYLEDGSLGRAAVPSGASTGIHEVFELRDNDPKLYLGKSVLRAVENCEGEISKAILGMDARDQKGIDNRMIDLDGTENKSRIGANAILAVSLACAKSVASAKKIPLYEYVAELNGKDKPNLLPMPMFNVLNGGKHAEWFLDFQEFLILPVSAKTFGNALQMGSEVFHNLGKVLKNEGYSLMVGDEGGYAPALKEGNTEALDLIVEAIKLSGYQIGEDVMLGMDVAASEFFKNGKYHLNADKKILTSDEMIELLSGLCLKYSIISIEDGLDQEDWEGWASLTKHIGQKLQLVGDDLLVTNIKFLKKAIQEKSANAILIKINQIGTLSETIAAVKMASDNGWRSIISHRSGETEDTTIAHLSVGLSTGQIKAGSVTRSERLAKYNELLRIEENLGKNARFLNPFTK